MIATHNIKVNGVWIHAGEEYNLTSEKKEAPVKAEKKPVVSVQEEAPEKEPEEIKPKTVRRKKVSG